MVIHGVAAIICTVDLFYFGQAAKTLEPEALGGGKAQGGREGPRESVKARLREEVREVGRAGPPMRWMGPG